MIEDKVVVNTAEVPSVALICSIKPEVCSVIDGRFADDGGGGGLVGAPEDQAEVTSRILWYHRADKGEAVASVDKSCLLHLLTHHGVEGNVWLNHDL